MRQLMASIAVLVLLSCVSMKEHTDQTLKYLDAQDEIAALKQNNASLSTELNHVREELKLYETSYTDLMMKYERCCKRK